ncbi:3-oxoacyl-[acyl-carrier protein] reductase [Candidatus Phaeomarinobacter ectocarpi]|uniref:3-oxoacyl-[acyl-carrier protein] reductase n=1 Tax=Candidatus Phaeomarinibacter ectocarpi TaxID=1458461 RepID=X5MBR2_9HYPH|nr:glucose 1-dehydrogenase [Candidatus Phaeomarinobacter ectocarpi]CDO58427.1 3-oxoacyl-[acyl-carrier protein] reductase [Candidatus Phaeomarinobacter ectocarpi]
MAQQDQPALAGKVALVTGGARGLGAASALGLAREGASVVVSDLRADEGQVVVDAILNEGGKAVFIAHDVTKEDQWEAAVAKAEEEFGALHILVNNAGVAPAGEYIEDLKLEDYKRVTEIDMDSVFLGCKHGIRTIKKYTAKEAADGAIINISSVMGIVGFPRNADYNAAKGGVRIMTKVAALECAELGYGIRVNSIHPGFIDTALVRDAVEEGTKRPDAIFQSSNEMIDMLVMAHPLGKLGDPRDIGDAVVFLASSRSGFITGTELVVDGGYTIQ